MNNDVIIKADNLYFSYDDEKSHSLNGLSLEIRRGRKIAFMEPTVPENPLFSCAATASISPPPAPSTWTGNPWTTPGRGC